MCWSIDKENFDNCSNIFHNVAEDDFIVYKIGKIKNGYFMSMFHSDFRYKANTIKHIKKISIKENTFYKQYFVERGYHSYSKECLLTIGLSTVDIKKLRLKVLRIDYLYNSSGVIEFYPLDSEIGKFIIPKGTEYYVNAKGEIVSSQIMWTGKYCKAGNIKKNLVEFKDLVLCLG